MDESKAAPNDPPLLTGSKLDEMRCPCGCGIQLVMRTCCPGTAFMVLYASGTSRLTLVCAECGKVVHEVAVAG